MPTRVLLEGPKIEPLLEQVRRDYGPTAKIISAEKVRTGGLAGFFARQRFELSVEVGDEPPAAAAEPEAKAPPRPAPRSLEELLDLAEADAGDLTAQGTAPARPPAAPAPTKPASAVSASATPAPAAPAAPAPASTAPAPRPLAGATPTTPTFAKITSAGPAAQQHTSVVPRAGLVSTNGTAFAEVMASLGAVSTPVAEPAQAPLTSTVRPYRPPTVSAAGPLTGALTALGVPEKLAGRASSADPYQAVLQALATLPEAPVAPARAGDVLVVVGELAHALPIAQRVAEDLHLDPAKLLLAGATTAGTGLHHSRRISGAAEARRRARTMHREDVPHVVVIDAPIGAPDDGWVEEICAELGATAVWAAVDATRKTADTAAHLRRIGPVTGIAVYAAAASADPAAPLALGHPVALLDGRPAGPHAWAALLTERLGELNPNGE